MQAPKNWSVWVGGIEVNDYMLSKEEALQVKEHYETRGYDDVQITQEVK